MKKKQKQIPVKLPRKKQTKQYTDEVILAEYASRDVQNKRMVEIYPDRNTKAKWAYHFLKLGLPMKRKRGETPEEVAAYHRRYSTDWRRRNPEKCALYRDKTCYNRATKLIASGEFSPLTPEKSEK